MASVVEIQTRILAFTHLGHLISGSVTGGMRDRRDEDDDCDMLGGAWHIQLGSSDVLTSRTKTIADY